MSPYGPDFNPIERVRKIRRFFAKLLSAEESAWTLSALTISSKPQEAKH